MRRPRLAEESGFTLVEVLVTMLMMLTVMFALYSIFDMSLRVFSYGNDKTEAVQNARQGLERMEREVRAAYPYDKANDEETLFPSYSSSTTDSITFGNDRNGDRQITVPDEEITYKLSAGSPYSLLRENPTGATPQPAVESVRANGLQFEYLDRMGTPVSNESDIEMVRIMLEIEVDDGTQELATDVLLRSRVDTGE
jgi:prepilin-type N-terminal cleavage/methylation domain-containing protein